MRITTVRIISQAVFMALFCAFVVLTAMAYLDQMPALKFWLSKFLEIDPLVGISTSITTHTLYKGLAWSLVLAIPTLLLGRLFCNWICPFGTLHHFTGWVLNQRTAKARIESNRYRPMYQAKYYILAAMLAAAVFGTLQIGLLDPICLIHRSFTTTVVPALNMPLAGVEPFGDPKLHALAWLIGIILLVFVGMNLLIPRFFCRVLCPLGATLGVLSRFSLWRIDRDPARCTNCGQCVKNCEGACDPDGDLRKSECFVCFNCIEECPHGALRFAFVPHISREVTYPDITGRRLALAGLAGVLFYPFTKLSGRSTKDFSTKVIRPPGSVEEQEFLKRCIKCDQCIRVCPTNVLQPAGLEAGLEGLWTPVMNFRMGFCQLNCTACGHVCPTGAIQQLSLDEKLGLGEFADAGPVRLGTAHYDRGRCLPWAHNKPCIVCEEVCPTSPKAIHTERMKLLIRDGKKQVITATPTTVTLAEHAGTGLGTGRRCEFRSDEFAGDQTLSYHLEIVHRDGITETHRIIGNTGSSVLIGRVDQQGRLDEGEAFARQPETHTVAAIHVEMAVPKVDIDLCIGCGQCEYHCPVVGDRRAVYVTPEDESRSAQYQQGNRNRSLRL